MKRSISPLTMLQAPEHERRGLSSFPKRKRTKRECSSSSCHSMEEDDVAALLLSLATKQSSLDSKERREMKSRLHVCEEPKESLSQQVQERAHRVVSDDEDESHLPQGAAQKKSRVSQVSSTCSQIDASSLQVPASTSTKVDWRTFSRPIGPPPRLPMVPAGFVFPPRNVVSALMK